MCSSLRGAFALLATSSLFVLAPALSAQAILPEKARVQASDAQPDAYFGMSVDADSQWIVSGAPLAGDRGEVYVYERGPVLQESKILPPHPKHGRFGWTVALREDWLFVGDPAHDSDRGRVNVYQYDGADWAYHGYKAGAAQGDLFGDSLDYEPATRSLVVGAPAESGVGRAYLYVRESGQFLLKTEFFDGFPAPSDRFGHDVDIDGDQLAISAPGKVAGRGSVFVYQGAADQWTSAGVLHHPHTQSGDRFGTSVSMDGPRLAIGAIGHDALALDAGAVFVYQDKGGSWNSPVKLLAWDGEAASLLGFKVRIQGEVVSAGAPYASLNQSAVGSVYQWRLRQSTWLPLQRLADHGWSPDRYHGWSLAMSGTELFVGVPGQSAGGAQRAGSVYIHDVPEFALDAEPSVGSLGANLQIGNSGGAPGRPVGLFVMGVDGVPFVRKLMLGNFAADGSWSLQGAYTDPALSGLVIDLQSFSLNLASKVESSNVFRLPLN